MRISGNNFFHFEVGKPAALLVQQHPQSGGNQLAVFYFHDVEGSFYLSLMDAIVFRTRPFFTFIVVHITKSALPVHFSYLSISCHHS